MNLARLAALTAATFVLLCGSALAQQTDAAVIAAQKPLYPATTCLVSGEELGSGGMVAVDLVHEGRLITLCCKGCIKGFEKDPAAHIAKLDAAVTAAQQAGYPLKTCIVSDEALDDRPTRVVHAGKLVLLCCSGCRKDFVAAPQTYMPKLDKAYIDAQLKDYPLDTCLIRGEELGTSPVSVLHGLQLVQLCCRNCAAQFAKDPAPALKKLAEVRAARTPAAKPAESGESADG